MQKEMAFHSPGCGSGPLVSALNLLISREGRDEVAGTSSQAQGKHTNAPKRPKHVPQRTCVACHQVKPKRELLRIVRTPDGRVVMDPTGKKSGRGAYLCANRSCWTNALKKKRLEQELETTISEEDRIALEQYADTLPPVDPARAAAPVTERT